jgi:hypothetical protein
MDAKAREATRGLAAGRLLLGISLCVAPNLATRWMDDAGRTPAARMIIRSLGARDAALGLGTLASLHEPAQLRRWLVLSSACDATDFAATLAGPAIRGRPAVLAMAAGGTLGGLALALALD